MILHESAGMLAVVPATPPQRKVESQREGGHAGATGSRGCYFVPEPETYALMLAGLGFVGFAARRRKSA